MSMLGAHKETTVGILSHCLVAQCSSYSQYIRSPKQDSKRIPKATPCSRTRFAVPLVTVPMLLSQHSSWRVFRNVLLNLTTTYVAPECVKTVYEGQRICNRWPKCGEKPKYTCCQNHPGIMPANLDPVHLVPLPFELLTSL